MLVDHHSTAQLQDFAIKFVSSDGLHWAVLGLLLLCTSPFDDIRCFLAHPWRKTQSMFGFLFKYVN